MIFDATWACPACRIRFPKSARCPACGAAPTFDLSTRSDRATFWRRVRGAAGGRGSNVGLRFLLARLGEWEPKRPWLVGLLGLALFSFVPAVYLMDGVKGFQVTYLVTSPGPIALEHRGLSQFGYQMILISGAGALILAALLLARLGALAAPRLGRSDNARRLRVAAPPPAASGATTLRGRVRGESTLESPIAARPCVAFGLAGEVSGSAVDDAMGADFALELDDRRRVLVELDHAVLEVDAPGSPAPAKAEDYLAEVLAGRGLPADGVALVEHVLSDGDEVTIEGELREEGIAQTGYRDATPARVLRGTPAAPLRIKKLAVSVES